MITRLKIWFKLIFNLPIYRVDILRLARKIIEKDMNIGLCEALLDASKTCYLYTSRSVYQPSAYRIYGMLCNHIPLFKANVEEFGGEVNGGFWWPINEAGQKHRLDYLDWLIEQYKNDKTDLRKL